MAFEVDGFAYVLAGPVTVDELDRVAAVVHATEAA
jgi:hypothetical protein